MRSNGKGKVAATRAEVQHDDGGEHICKLCCKRKGGTPEDFSLCTRDEGLWSRKQLNSQEMLPPGKMRQRNAGDPFLDEGLEPGTTMLIQVRERDSGRLVD